MNIIELNNQIEEFVQKNDLSADALVLKQDNAISSSAEWQKVLDDFAETGRLLRIGIIGRVKAGKSSLLNAVLFNGQDILPKAATPMTAALTVMEYSEKVSAEVDFFTKEDIDDIRRKHDDHLQRFAEQKIQAIEESKDRALRKKKKLDPKAKLTSAEVAECEAKAIATLESEMKNAPTYAAYDQYNRIEKSGKTLADLAAYKTIDAASIEDLMSKLNDFVGVEGRFMPFTKAVKLSIPHEGLKGLQIIDTPGINDPVTSRGARTEEMLQHCDAVLVVSPSGQFLSAEDTDLLHRITTREGTQEAYLIASQADNQLFGSEKGNATDPAEVIQRVANTLTIHARDVLQKQVKQYPLMKVAADKLSQNTVICSSSVAYAMAQRFNEQHNWDENLNHVWNNLRFHYPEKFAQNADTAIAALNQLANISMVNQVFTEVNERKSEILQKRQIDFENAKRNALIAYLDGLDNFISEKIQKIEDSDVATLRQQIQEMEICQRQIKDELGDIYNDFVFKVKLKLDPDMKYALSGEMSKYTSASNSAQGTETKTERYLYEKASWWQFWKDDEYRTRSYSVNSVNATQVRRAIIDVKNGLETQLNLLALTFQQNWKKEFCNGMIGKIRRIMGDGDIDISLVRHTLNKILAEIPEANFKIKSELPDILQKTGKLEGADADKFNRVAEDYVYTLEDNVKNSIDYYINKYFNYLKSQDLVKTFVDKLDEDLKELVNEIENKEASLFYYNKLKKELAQLKKTAQ